MCQGADGTEAADAGRALRFVCIRDSRMSDFVDERETESDDRPENQSSSEHRGRRGSKISQLAGALLARVQLGKLCALTSKSLGDSSGCGVCSGGAGGQRQRILDT